MIIGGEEFISYEAAAERCGCQVRRIADAIRAGHLSWCKPGKKRLVSVRDVEAWLQSMIHRPRPAARPVGRPRYGARR